MVDKPFKEITNEQSAKEADDTWLWRNLAKPFLYTLAEAYNTLNSAPKFLIGSSPFPDVHIELSSTVNVGERQNQAKIGLDTAAQIIGQGLAGVIVYTAAGRSVGALARLASENSYLRQGVPAFLGTDTGSMIAGAALYDGARAPKEGETRIGNSLSGAAAFAVFMGSHKPINKLTESIVEISGNRILANSFKLASYPFVGAVGGLVQKQVSVGYSQTRLMDENEGYEAALGGALMNSLLPGTLHLFGKAANKLNETMGRGIPVERYVERYVKEHNLTNKGLNSGYLAKLVENNPHARVQIVPENISSANSQNGKITLKNDSIAELAHELQHIESKKSTYVKEQYDLARKFLLAGDINKSRDIFMSTRLFEETLSVKAAETANGDSRSNVAVETAERRDLGQPSTSAVDTKHLRLWESQFEDFVKSRGETIPLFDYSANDSGGAAGSTGRPRGLFDQSLENLQKAKAEISKSRGQDIDIDVPLEAMSRLNFRTEEPAKIFLSFWLKIAEHDRAALSLRSDSTHVSISVPTGQNIDLQKIRILAMSSLRDIPAPLARELLKRDDLYHIAAEAPSVEKLTDAIAVWQGAPSVPLSLTHLLKSAESWHYLAAETAAKEIFEAGTNGALKAESIHTQTLGRGEVYAEADRRLLAAARAEASEKFQRRLAELISSGPEQVFALQFSPMPAIKYFHGNKYEPEFQAEIAGALIGHKLYNGQAFPGIELVNIIKSLEPKELVSAHKAINSLDPYGFKTAEAENGSEIRSSSVRDPRISRHTLPEQDRAQVAQMLSAIKLVSTFGSQWRQVLSTAKEQSFGIDNLLNSIALADPKLNSGLANFILANSHESFGDIRAITAVWHMLSAEQKKLSFVELEREATKLHPQAFAEQARDSIIDYSHQLEWMAKIADQLPNLSRDQRNAIQLYKDKWHLDEKQEAFLLSQIGSNNLHIAYEKLGLTADVTREFHRSQYRNRDINDLEDVAINMTHIFGNRVGQWYDLQASLGRGPLEASAVATRKNLPDLFKTIPDYSNLDIARTRSVSLADVLLQYASEPIGKLASLSRAWVAINEIDKSGNVKGPGNSGDKIFLGPDYKQQDLKTISQKAREKIGNWLTFGDYETQPLFRNLGQGQDARTRLAAEPDIMHLMDTVSPELLIKIARQFRSDENGIADYVRLAKVLEHSGFDLKKLESINPILNQELTRLMHVLRDYPKLVEDKRLWEFYRNSGDQSIINLEKLISSWSHFTEDVKQLSGKQALSQIWTPLDLAISSRLAIFELESQNLADWQRLAANIAWRRASLEAKPEESFQEFFQQELAKGQEANIIVSGVESMINSWHRHLDGTRRYLLSETIKRTIPGASDQDLAAIIRNLNSNTFFANLALLGKKIDNEQMKNIDESFNNTWEAVSALKLTSIFDSRANGWLKARKRAGYSMHDSTEFLPVLTPEKAKSLADYLFAQAKDTNKQADIRVVADNWNSITQDMQRLPLTELARELGMRSYKDAKSSELAREAAKWGISAKDYIAIEERFLRSLADPENINPFPHKQGESWTFPGGLKGYFLAKNDPRGIFLGHHTNCCQHPGHAQGREAAWHGQESPNAGFFVVEDKSGKILAMSLVHNTNSGKGKNNVLFDNVEAEGLGKRDSAIAGLYQKVADVLVEKYNYDQINLGKNMGDLNTNYWLEAHGSSLIPLPRKNNKSSEVYAGYSDASTQVILSSRDLIDRHKVSDRTANGVVLAKIQDIESMHSIAEQVYPEGWRWVLYGDQNLLLNVDGKPVGYATLTKNKEITDIAVLPEARTKSNQLLKELFEIVRNEGGIWSIDARESTTFRLVTSYNGRKIDIVDEHGQLITEPNNPQNYKVIDRMKNDSDAETNQSDRMLRVYFRAREN